MGAEVIKVEDTGRGDFCRHDEPVMQGESYYFTALARNKKSLSVNLKSREGKEIFHKLAAKSDIILESFRPGVTTRLGIDYDKGCKAGHHILFIIRLRTIESQQPEGTARH